VGGNIFGVTSGDDVVVNAGDLCSVCVYAHIDICERICIE